MTMADLASVTLPAKFDRMEWLESRLDQWLERVASAQATTDASGSLLEDPFGFDDMILARSERVMLKLRALYDHRREVLAQLPGPVVKLIG